MYTDFNRMGGDLEPMDTDSKPRQIFEEIRSAAENEASDIVAWRREFHQFPELAYEENVTASRITAALDAMPGIGVVRGLGTPTSVIGFLRGDIEAPSLVLRADMDALAIEEETGLPFSSGFPGVMHACGHDCHMASLLGAARILSERADMLKRPVVFLFQPAEEGRGGARKILQGGLLERFNAEEILGLHFWPQMPFGQMATRPGILTAISDRIHIEISGSSAHAASPHLGVDSTLVAAHILITLQSLISRELDPQATAVISFGRMEAGDAYNIVPGKAHLWGTLRTFDEQCREFLQKRLEEMIPLTARAHKAMASVEYTRNYPPVVNDPELCEKVFEKAADFFEEKDQILRLKRPLLAGEDFAFYSLRIPSCLMLFGTGSELGLHHPCYDVPEDLLPAAAAWEACLALDL